MKVFLVLCSESGNYEKVVFEIYTVKVLAVNGDLDLKHETVL